MGALATGDSCRAAGSTLTCHHIPRLEVRPTVGRAGRAGLGFTEVCPPTRERAPLRRISTRRRLTFPFVATQAADPAL
jgi:hypothetical protein